MNVMVGITRSKVIVCFKVSRFKIGASKVGILTSSGHQDLPNQPQSLLHAALASPHWPFSTRAWSQRTLAKGDWASKVLKGSSALVKSLGSVSQAQVSLQSNIDCTSTLGRGMI